MELKRTSRMFCRRGNERFSPHLCDIIEGSGSNSTANRGNFYNRCMAWLLSCNPLTSIYIKNRDALRKEIKKHAGETDLILIHPLSLFNWWWSCFIALVCLLCFVAAPLRFGFSLKKPPFEITSLDYFLLSIDVIFLIDILKTFNTGYIKNYTLERVLNKPLVRKHYLKTYFIVDLLSSLPIDFMCLAFTQSPEAYFISQLKYAIKLFRYNTFNQNFKALLNYIFCVKRYITLVVSFILITHWSTCLLSFSGTIALTLNDTNGQSWIFKSEIAEQSASVKYATGYLMTISFLISAGFGSNAPVVLREIVLFVLMKIFFSLYRFILLVMFVAEYMNRSCAFSQSLETENQLQEYMNNKQLPSNIRNRFNEYYHYKFQNYYFDEDVVMSFLSEHLRAEIALDQCKNVMNSDILNNLPVSVKGKILSKLNYEVFLPGDIIVKAGSIENCVYFILSGTVAIYTSMGKEVCHLYDGDYFGEVALLMKNSKRGSTAVAIAITEVFRLDMKDFREYVSENRDLFKQVKNVSNLRMQETTEIETRDNQKS